MKLRRGRSGLTIDDVSIGAHSTRNTGWPGSRSSAMAIATAIRHRAGKQKSWNGLEPKRPLCARRVPKLASQSFKPGHARGVASRRRRAPNTLNLIYDVRCSLVKGRNFSIEATYGDRWGTATITEGHFRIFAEIEMR
jgi:hypothetical protein